MLGCLVSIGIHLSGCNAPRDELAEFNRFYERGDMLGAETYLQKKVRLGPAPAGEDLLWAVQRGLVERVRKNYDTSNQWFDRAEDMSKVFDSDLRALDAVGTTIVNDNAMPYRGEAYDMIMVNTYKAINFMALGKDDLARVEFNRALDRQMRARQRFSQEIQKRKAQMEQDAKGKKVNLKRTLEDPNTEARIRQQYSNLYDFQAYPDFVNPMATYLAGIFFMMTRDPGKAVDPIKESSAMVPENEAIAQDFEAVQQWLDRGRAPAPCVWVVYENGLGPVKEEFRVDLPLWLVSNEMVYAGVALPKLLTRGRATEHMDVNTAGTWVQTELVADMDRVIQTEFSKDFPGILARAILAASAKAVVQHALLDRKNSSGSQFLGLMMASYAAATTVADVRIWTGLPKEFQVARVPMPAHGRLDIRLAGRSMEILIDRCQYALVHVKMVSGQGEPLWEVITR